MWKTVKIQIQIQQAESLQVQGVMFTVETSQNTNTNTNTNTTSGKFATARMSNVHCGNQSKLFFFFGRARTKTAKFGFAYNSYHDMIVIVTIGNTDCDDRKY